MPIRVIGTAGGVIGCFFRDSSGNIQETQAPKGEPDPYDVPASLYCGAYTMKSRLFGPPKFLRGDVLIFNRRDYRPDPELVAFVKERIKEAVFRIEGRAVVEEAGGLDNLEMVVDTFWREAKG